MQIRLSKQIYSKEAILKASFACSDKFFIDINVENDDFVLNIKMLKNEIFDKAFFIRGIQEQQLREDLNRQFSHLRDEIYKRAFSLME